MMISQKKRKKGYKNFFQKKNQNLKKILKI